MSHTKMKIKNHIIGEKAVNIIKKSLPEHWTIREYTPDYGIDLAIEVFEETQSDKHEILYETLGEHFFVQVKGTENIELGKFNIYTRKNVEKFSKSTKEKTFYKEIEVVKFQIETSELYTIERMSPGVPVFLFVVDTIESKIYYVCLNDYIDKVIIPEKPNYFEQGTIVINIPTENKIDDIGIKSLLLYSKRPKLYSFFHKIDYQVNELYYINDEDLLEISTLFAYKLLRYDIWSLSDRWSHINMLHQKLMLLVEKQTASEVVKCNFDNNERIYETGNSVGLLTEYEAHLYNGIRSIWNSLNLLSNFYEDNSREWFLPTYYNIIINEG